MLEIDSPVKQVTYATLKKSDPCHVENRPGNDMDANPSTDTDDTNILDEDVMEEMENLEATVVLPETMGEFDDFDTQDNDFLDDFGATTVVLSDQPYLVR